VHATFTDRYDLLDLPLAPIYDHYMDLIKDPLEAP
jgi:hypothetical protein